MDTEVSIASKVVYLSLSPNIIESLPAIGYQIKSRTLNTNPLKQTALVTITEPSSPDDAMWNVEGDAVSLNQTTLRKIDQLSIEAVCDLYEGCSFAPSNQVLSIDSFVLVLLSFLE